MELPKKKIIEKTKKEQEKRGRTLYYIYIKKLNCNPYHRIN